MHKTVFKQCFVTTNQIVPIESLIKACTLLRQTFIQSAPSKYLASV